MLGAHFQWQFSAVSIWWEGQWDIDSDVPNFTYLMSFVTPNPIFLTWLEGSQDIRRGQQRNDKTSC